MTRGSSRISKLFGNGSDRTSDAADQDGLRYYLLVYDTAAQSLRHEPHEFVDAEDAQSAFVQAEERLRGDSELQVVMFVARSLDNVRSTHPHYFDDAGPRGDTVDFLIPHH